tara:strand:- start:51 stop:191 length:141 start_codon:yes stop_codon:yes gene_type:complete
MTDLEKKQYKRLKELEDINETNDRFINGCLPLMLVGLGILALLIFG